VVVRVVTSLAFLTLQVEAVIALLKEVCQGARDRCAYCCRRGLGALSVEFYCPVCRAHLDPFTAPVEIEALTSNSSSAKKKRKRLIVVLKYFNQHFKFLIILLYQI
jgi:hypothetical protein